MLNIKRLHLRSYELIKAIDINFEIKIEEVLRGKIYFISIE